MGSTSAAGTNADMSRVAWITLAGIAASMVQVLLSCNCSPDWTSYLLGVAVLSLGIPPAIRLVRAASRTWRSAFELTIVAVFALCLAVSLATTGSAMNAQERSYGSYWHREGADR